MKWAWTRIFALFGISLLLLGVFNWVFFTKYYRNVQKVGMPFNIACAVYFVLLCVAETAAHIVPFVRDKLDTPDPQFFERKAGGAGSGGFSVCAAYTRCLPQGTKPV